MKGTSWLSAIVTLVALLIWEMAVRVGYLSALFFPAPSAIAGHLLAEMASGAVWPHLGATLIRLGSGFLVGGIVGLAVGLWMGWSPTVNRLADPFVAALHPLPKIALLPLAMVILGIGELSNIALIAIATFFPMLINTVSGVRQLDPIYLEVAHNYRTPLSKLFTRIILPGSLPFIFAGARIALNTALLMTITVELLTAKTGLGGIIWLAWQTLRMERLYVALLVTSLLGIGSNALLHLVARRVMPWRPTENHRLSSTTMANHHRAE